MILVTGGNGFLGKEICNMLHNYGLKHYRFSSKDCDLRDPKETAWLFDKVKPTHVIHAGARLGGIKDNLDNPYYYYRDNIEMGMNVVNNVVRTNVEHLINIATCCSYPQNAIQPFKEFDLNDGLPAKASMHYGMAKREVVNYSEIASETFGFQLTNLISTNLFGIGDDFRPQTSHVIPALIMKISKAKRDNTPLHVWGNREVTRDFITPSFLSDHIGIVLEREVGYGRVNISSGMEVSIGAIVEFLCDWFDFKGKVIFEEDRPTGQPTRQLSQIRQHREFGKIYFNFWYELDLLCDYYVLNEEEILLQTETSKF